MVTSWPHVTGHDQPLGDIKMIVATRPPKSFLIIDMWIDVGDDGPQPLGDFEMTIATRRAKSMVITGMGVYVGCDGPQPLGDFEMAVAG